MYGVYTRTTPKVTRWIRFVCWFSARYWDIHDYPSRSGGDDIPTHMHTYECWNCGKRFHI